MHCVPQLPRRRRLFSFVGCYFISNDVTRTLACPTQQQHTNMGPARTLGRCEAPPCVFARVVSRSALSARDAAPGHSCPRVRTSSGQCAHTPSNPPCFDPAWCGVLRTRRHGPPPLSFPVGHELPVPGSPTEAPRGFPSAARLRFRARLGPFVRCRAGSHEELATTRTGNA